MANTNMEIVFEGDKLYKLLELFDLIDLYDLLKEHNITEESLKFMQSSHINELFPKELLGRKIIFEQRLKEWQIEQGVKAQRPDQDQQNPFLLVFLVRLMI
ncbi:uncharacterized protein LOC118732394 isoform X2 [Rhagoletis pomonella]|uniref:uncharacterized protein LOC118732394 isoform X2 n=1 Tax=Rhagoletis pomonella TaxID=28610 RepID=UPI00178222B1|nr:uncharacterized protein LOC118732394 isoform X2 [Rhagoletis pomonella]XP_036317419.1 uncharacterized protein LOC118732394 isoform X2 [Rhagoletis pomonella]